MLNPVPHVICPSQAGNYFSVFLSSAFVSFALPPVWSINLYFQNSRACPFHRPEKKNLHSNGSIKQFNSSTNDLAGQSNSSTSQYKVLVVVIVVTNFVTKSTSRKKTPIFYYGLRL